MNPYYAHLKSEIACTVYANGEYLGVCKKREPLDLRVSTNDVFFNISPIGNYYPYTIHISNTKKCVDTTNNCLIVPYYNNNYDIFLKHIKIYENTPTTTLLNTTIGKITITILNGINSSIAIYENGSIMYSDNISLLSKVTANIVQGNIIVKGFTTTEEYYLMILNSNYELIYSGYFDNLEENDKILTGFSNIYDLAKHGHVCEIDLNNTSNINDFYVVKENLKLCDTCELIPEAFLQALKLNNFSLAKQYLSDNLSKASNSHFKTYFGDIQSIYYNQYNNSFPINYTLYNGEYKSYNFNIVNNKINDIEECKFC